MSPAVLRRRLTRRLAHALLAALAAATGVAAAQAPSLPGNAPTYVWRSLATPGTPAIVARFWVPHLNEGFVPQGVAHGEGFVWLAGYVSTDPRQDRGQCTVFQVDPEQGGVVGQFALPASCGHAGGIAWGGDGILWVADTRTLYRVDTHAALAAGRCVEFGCNEFRLADPLVGSFLGIGDGSLWLGEYRAQGKGPGRLWRLPISTVMGLIGLKGDVQLQYADRSLPIAAQSQGVAIGSDGSLWLAQSGSDFGMLQKVDPQSGEVKGQWSMPAGIEDIEFGPDGFLWAVSEAGSQRWQRWTTFFPVVFTVETARLR